MKITLAIFAKPGSEITSSDIWDMGIGPYIAGRVQRCAPVEVDFQLFPQEQTVSAELAILDEMKKKINDEARASLNVIEEQRAKLLAITDQRSAA